MYHGDPYFFCGYKKIAARLYQLLFVKYILFKMFDVNALVSMIDAK